MDKNKNNFVLTTDIRKIKNMLNSFIHKKDIYGWHYASSHEFPAISNDLLLEISDGTYCVGHYDLNENLFVAEKHVHLGTDELTVVRWKLINKE